MQWCPGLKATHPSCHSSPILPPSPAQYLLQLRLFSKATTAHVKAKPTKMNHLASSRLLHQTDPGWGVTAKLFKPLRGSKGQTPMSLITELTRVAFLGASLLRPGCKERSWLKSLTLDCIMTLEPENGHFIRRSRLPSIAFQVPFMISRPRCWEHPDYHVASDLAVRSQLISSQTFRFQVCDLGFGHRFSCFGS